MLNKFVSKYFAFFLSVAVFLGALTGCAGSEVVKLNPKDPVTITIWHYYHGAQKSAFDTAIKEFNDTVGYEKGIIAEAVSYGGVNELAENVTSAAKGELDAGEMPDIFGAYGDTTLEILKMEMITEIDQYLSEDKIAEYEESFIHEGKLGTDHIYVFPIAKSTESLMLNKTDFDVFAAAVAEPVSYEDLLTWEGILRVSDIYYSYTQSLSSDGVGKAFFGLDGLANYLIIGSKQLGQDIVKIENGSMLVNTDKDIMSKLWYTYYEPMVTGRFTKLGRFCSDDIKTGDSLCFVGSTASASYFPSELLMADGQTKEIEMLALPMPIFENGDKISISQGAGMSVAKSSKQKEYASVLFLEWFTDAERNVEFSLNSSYLPVKKDALDENILSAAFASIADADAGTQNAVKALKVGIEQLNDFTFYSSEVFDGSADFRSRLPVILENAVIDDRALYLELLGTGLSDEQAYAEIFAQSSDKFENWLASLRK